jgi:hypothetical protein
MVTGSLRPMDGFVCAGIMLPDPMTLSPRQPPRFKRADGKVRHNVTQFPDP